MSQAATTTDFLILWNTPSTPYYSCSSNSCVASSTCAGPGNGCYANDNTCGNSCLAAPTQYYSCSGSGNSCAQDPTCTVASSTCFADSNCSYSCPGGPPPPAQYYSCSGSGNSCAQDPTCTVASSTCFVDGHCGYSCPGGPSNPFSASLTANPASVSALSSTTLTAVADNGTPGDTYNYTFWSDCPPAKYTGNSVSDATAACGAPVKKDDGVSAASDSISATYPTAGTFDPLVIVENGSNSPAPATALVTVTPVTPSGCAPGTTQSCKSTPNTQCGLQSSGTETCQSDRTWGSCDAVTPPNDLCNPVVIESFIATPTQITYTPESSLLLWVATGADSCGITDSNGAVDGTGLAINSSLSVQPATTTAYYLRCSNSYNSASSTASVTVTVTGSHLHEGQ